MSAQEILSASQKLGSFIELFSRAQKVLHGAAEAESTLSALKDEIASAAPIAEKAKAELASVLSELASAKAAVASAKEEAAGVAARATEAARKIIDAAREEGEQASSELSISIAQLTQRLVSIKNDIAQAELDHGAASEQLAETLKKIADAKAAALAALS